MRSIGCLIVIAIIVVGIYLLASTKDMTDQEKAQWVGEKAHRGWNRVKRLAEGAREGWKSAPQDRSGKDARPADGR